MKLLLFILIRKWIERYNEVKTVKLFERNLLQSILIYMLNNAPAA